MEPGFPVVMLVGPALAAVVTLILRPFRRGQIAAGLVALGLLMLLLVLAAPGVGLLADSTAGFYGRELILTPFARSLFLLIYPALGALFAVAWFRPAGRVFIPAGLAALSPLAAAVMITPPGLGTVLLVAAAAVVTPAVHGGRHEPAGAAWRYFLFTAAAVAPALLAASMPAAGGGATGWTYALLAALILLGGFPFYSWATGLGRAGFPATVALVLGLMPIAVVVVVMALLDSAPAARAAAGFQLAVRWSAVLTALIAVLHMSRAGNTHGLVAGAVLFDMAFVLIATLSPGADGLFLALPALISRMLSLLLIALGANWRPGDGSPPGRWPEALAGLALPYGLLSLIGLPLTAGFGGRWGLVAAAAPGGLWPTVALVGALFMASFVVMRAFIRLPAVETPVMAAVPMETGLTLLLLGLAILVGLLPDLLPALVSRMLCLG